MKDQESQPFLIFLNWVYGLTIESNFKELSNGKKMAFLKDGYLMDGKGSIFHLEELLKKDLT